MPKGVIGFGPTKPALSSPQIKVGRGELAIKRGRKYQCSVFYCGHCAGQAAVFWTPGVITHITIFIQNVMGSENETDRVIAQEPVGSDVEVINP